MLRPTTPQETKAFLSALSNPSNPHAGWLTLQGMIGFGGLDLWSSPLPHATDERWLHQQTNYELGPAAPRLVGQPMIHTSSGAMSGKVEFRLQVEESYADASPDLQIDSEEYEVKITDDATIERTPAGRLTWTGFESLQFDVE